MFHITNGSSVRIVETGIGGEVLTWDDALHEGPVPAGLPPAELTKVRAEFTAASGRCEPKAARRHFQERARRLESSLAHDEVILWFEHDLYDQLQLIQLLDWFAGRREVKLIQPDRFLGPMDPGELRELFPMRAPVTAAQFGLAVRAWAAFRAPEREALDTLLANDTSALPFLAPALARHLEEFPAARDGLGRTERTILELLAERPYRPHDLFQAYSQREEARFLGDLIFYDHLKRLSSCRTPLIATDEAASITAAGLDVLTGRAHHIRLNGIDRWLGGVHLKQ